MSLLFYQSMMFTCVSLPEKILFLKTLTWTSRNQRAKRKVAEILYKALANFFYGLFRPTFVVSLKNLCDFASLRLRVKVFLGFILVIPVRVWS
jgi:hypothetical protein